MRRTVHVFCLSHKTRGYFRGWGINLYCSRCMSKNRCMNTMPVVTHKSLIVWQRSMQLVIAMYELTDQFPDEEKFGLVSQMRRAAVSIPSNIAEGRRRGTKKNFLSFLRIAYGSGSELETQIEISKALRKTKQLDYKQVETLLNEVMRMLNSMLRHMNPSH